MGSSDGAARVDTVTVIALAAMASVIATALHEHGGHAAACAAIGAHINELNAFYVQCDYGQLSDPLIRAVPIAGPLVSLLTGIAALTAALHLRRAPAIARVFLWLLGAHGLMEATGYLLFSGVMGIGDFGTSRDGAIYQLHPQWLFRGLLTVVGAASYFAVVRAIFRGLDGILGGSGPERVARIRRLALAVYLTGGAVSIAIGLFNPRGIVIVLVSSVASSLGGTSGLLWGANLLDRKRETGRAPLGLARSWAWIAAAIVVVAAYGIFFGPSIRF